MKKLIFALLFLVVFNIENTQAQYITVNDSFTAAQLVQSFFANSSGCGQATNISVTGGNFTAAQSFGFYTNGGTSFPLQDGIILSTGRATSAIGPNTGNSSETLSGWSGDNDLNTALGLSNTFDATVLEFDFTPYTNKISFDYVFSSEQYLSNPSSNQCGFTDGFAFLIKPVGGSYQNIALVPGTTTPVSVNTIRGSGTICPASNEAYFDAFNGFNHPTTFNGQTKVLKAKADVVAGNSYHIKLVIADQGNGLYDSAIFLGGGTFQSETDLGADRLIATNNPYCFGDVVTLNGLQPGANTYRWYKDGVFTGVTSATYSVTDNINPNVVEYSVEVMINGSCLSTGKIKLQFTPLPTLVNQTYIQCDYDLNGETVYNLTKLDDLIKNNNSSLSTVTYFETIGGTQIANPSNYVSVPKTIYAKVSNSYGCISYAQIDLQISNQTYSDFVHIVCDDFDGNQDGLVKFDPNTEITPIFTTTFPVEYYLSQNDALLQTNPVTQFENIVPYDQNTLFIWARIIDGKDCVSIFRIQIKVKGFLPTDFEDETVAICENSSVNIGVSNNYQSYLWNTSETTNQITVGVAGQYSVQITNSDGCTDVKNFTVINSAPATNLNAEIVSFTENNSITITYISNGGNYEFSIDGVNYQDAPYFENIPAGIYTIYVKDKNGCLPIATKEVVVLDYPKFFTPNNDGFNDVWKIDNIDVNSKVSIFNRFGKLIKQITAFSGWDGNYLGKPATADDYWFILTLSDGKSIKSHFSLKR